MNSRTVGSLAAASVLLLGACTAPAAEQAEHASAATPVASAKPLDRIQAAVSKQVEGAKVSGSARLPMVTFRVRDGWTDSSTGDGAKDDVMKIVKAVHDADVTPSTLRVSGTLMLVDQYGNESRQEVIWAMFDRATLQQLNYGSDAYILLDPEDLALSFTLHPAIS